MEKLWALCNFFFAAMLISRVWFTASVAENSQTNNIFNELLLQFEKLRKRWLIYGHPRMESWKTSWRGLLEWSSDITWLVLKRFLIKVSRGKCWSGRNVLEFRSASGFVEGRMWTESGNPRMIKISEDIKDKYFIVEDSTCVKFPICLVTEFTNSPQISSNSDCRTNRHTALDQKLFLLLRGKKTSIMTCSREHVELVWRVNLLKNFSAHSRKFLPIKMFVCF